MPEAPIPCEPAGFGPSIQPGDMNNQSQINRLACADARWAAGHDAAVCFHACSECSSSSAGVYYARDASELSPTTIQAVAPQAQNFGTGAAAIALVPQPSTIENAGADASKVSISKCSSKFDATPSFDDNWTECLGKTARGRARRSAVCGPSDPSVSVRPSTGATSLDAAAPSDPSVRPSAGVTSFDAVAPSVTLPSVPSAALPLPPWGTYDYDRSGTLNLRSVRSAVAPSVAMPSAPSVAPSVALPAPSAGITPGSAASPVVYSVSPATIPQAASTNDSPIPAGAAAASTNDPKSISSVVSTPLSGRNPCACGTSPTPSPFDRLVKSGIKLTAAAGT